MSTELTFTDHEAVEAWAADRTAEGWTVKEKHKETVPNPYGWAGDCIVTEWHLLDGNGDYAGVLVKEAYWDRRNVMQMDFTFTPFFVEEGFADSEAFRYA